MDRIDQVFKRLQQRKERAFIPFLTLGYPDVDSTFRLVLELEKRGADIIELGVPFSDPLADGRVIQTASYEALKNGVNLRQALKFVRRIREKSRVPLLFMGYYNPVFRMGEENFIREANQAGLDGLIIADLPPEEAKDLVKRTRKNNLALIFLITPVSSDHRIKLICKLSQGFIYCVSYTGVTGERKAEIKKLKILLKKIRSLSSIPVAVGFGISSAREARSISSFADGVIVGSAIIRKIKESKSKKDMVKKVGEFALSLSQAIKNKKP